MGEESISTHVQATVDRVESVIREDLGLFRSVRGDMENMRSNLYTIQVMLPDAEEKKETDTRVESWREKTMEIIADFYDKLTDWKSEAVERKLEGQGQFRNKMRDLFSAVDPLFFDSRLALQVREMNQKLHELVEEGLKLGLKLQRKRQRDEAYSRTIQLDARGREEDREWLVEHLLRK